MKIKHAAALLCCVLFNGFTTWSAELGVVSDLNQLGRMIPSRVREKRVGLLKNLRLPATRNSNPTFSELLALLNEELAAKKVSFQLVVHVNKANEAWWKEAQKMTLSESYEMRAANANRRRKYLTTVSGWDIMKLVSLGWGTPDPLFFQSAIILSPEVGGMPTTLKEHMPAAKASGK